MNWLLIAVAFIFLVCMIVGYVKGFVKIAASVGATVAVIVLTFVLSPYTAKLLMKSPIDEMIKDRCNSVMNAKLSEGVGLMEDGMLDMLPEGVDIEDADLEALGIDIETLTEAAKDVELTKQAQIEIIENAELPKFFRESLLDNNNSEVYEALGVDNFFDYIGAYLSKLIIDMVSYLLTFLVVTIVVRAVLFAFDIIANLPVIGGFNRLAGAGLGLITGLVIVWTLFFVVLLLYGTSIGTACTDWIGQNEILTFLYENNLLLKWATAFK